MRSTATLNLTAERKPSRQQNQRKLREKPAPPPKDTKNGIQTLVISDSFADTYRFADKVSDHQISCKKFVNISELSHSLPTLLKEIRNPSEGPDLIWVTTSEKPFVKAGMKKQHLALQLLLEEQIRAGRQVFVEGAAMTPTANGIHFSEDWALRHPQLGLADVLWSALGLTVKGQKDKGKPRPEVFTRTLTSFPIAECYLEQEEGDRTGRIHLPKHTPATYHESVARMIREAWIHDVSQQSPSSPDDVSPSCQERRPDPSSSSFPTDAKIKAKRKQKPTGEKTLTEDDGPGEHAENLQPLKPCKTFENVFDDCGDDITPILDDSFISAFYGDDDDTVYDDTDDDQDLDSTYDSTFTTWSCPGSYISEDSDSLSDRPHAQHFQDVHEVLAFLSSNNDGNSQHDVFELFGGRGGTVQLAARRKLRTGQNHDITCGINLLDPNEVKAVYDYVKKYRPKVMVAAPPCTAFGPWSRFNRVHHPEAWQRSYVVGKALADLTANLCLLQWLAGRHFVVENPAGSALWDLPSFAALLQKTEHFWAYLEQCAVGLTDPDGIATVKPTLFLASSESLIWRLRRTCPGDHPHVALAGKAQGISRCKYAQTWTRTLVELLVAGIMETLKHEQTFHIYPLRVTSSDPYAGASCPGCRAHARSSDPRHNRIKDICRFPNIDTVTWQCNACRKHLPSTHSTHTKKEDCQWTLARPRKSTTHQPDSAPEEKDTPSFPDPDPSEPAPDAEPAAREPSAPSGHRNPEHPFRRLLQQWGEDDEVAEPLDHGDEPVIPVADPPGEQAEDRPLPDPDWSSFDLGKSLKSLKGDDKEAQITALKRLHLRWWHLSSERMSKILRAAGVLPATLDLVKGVCESCKACRTWQRPGHKSAVNTRLSEKLGEVVQFDLLFVGEEIIAVLLDECTRYTVAEAIPSKSTEDILRFVTDRWVRIFGPMSTLLSDQEGGLTSEQTGIWAERFGISLRFKPKGSHATMIERHHAILRDLIHKIQTQAEHEKITIAFSDILSEAILAKNIFLNIGGFSPHQGVFGRQPACLSDFENLGRSAIGDAEGGLPGTSRHAVRLREIAVSSMVQATALARLQRSEHHNARPTGEALQLTPGDMVDLYRSPAQKDLQGWRGPCEVLSTRGLASGVIDVRWGGRTMTARIQDLRKSILLVFSVITSTVLPLQLLRDHIMQMTHGQHILAWVATDKGWHLSEAATKNPSVFNAILHVAVSEIGITRCIGARVGRGFGFLPGLIGVNTSCLMWWPVNRPALYQLLEHAGSQTINLKHVFVHEQYSDFAYAQFLSTDVTNARQLRRLNPHRPLLAHDDDDPDQPRERDAMSDISTRRPSMNDDNDQPPDQPPPPPPFQPFQPVGPQPIATDMSTNSHRTQSTIHYPQPIEPIRIDTQSTIPYPQPSERSRSSRGGTSSASTSHHHVEPTMQKRNLPSGASSSHRPTKTSKAEPPSAPEPAPLPTASELPPLPLEEDEEELNPPGLEPEEDNDEAGNDLLFVGYHCPFGDEGVPHLIYVNSKGEVIEEKIIGELSADEVEKHWEEVATSVRKECRSFAELDVFDVVPKGTTNNCMSSRFVLRWKFDELKKIRTLKARLTVRGFLDKQWDLETFAGTASRWAQKFVVAICVQQGWVLRTADVGAAFLRGVTFKQLAELTGQPLRRCAFSFPKGWESFLKELPGCEHFNPEVHELEMKKPVYGLKDAPRAWRTRLDMAMTALKGISLRADRAIYIWVDENNCLLAICSAHVDDLKLGGTDALVERILKALAGWFGALKVVTGTFEHCGVIHEVQPDLSYQLHQQHFAERLKNLDLSQVPTHLVEQPLNEKQLETFSSALGSLAWLIQTRMDIAIYVQALQRASKGACIAHLVKLNAVIKWCKRKRVVLNYLKIVTPWLKVLLVADAAFRREDTTGLAMRGSIIGLGDDHGHTPGGICNVLEFFSRRQRRIVRSTFGGETNSLADGLEVAKMICYTLAEMMNPNSTAASIVRMEETGCLPVSIQAITDCKSLLDALKAPETRVPTESSLIMILLQIKESMRLGTISALTWVDTRDMVADGLNKGAIARAGLLNFSNSGIWQLAHDVVTHYEPLRMTVPSQLEQYDISGNV